jgi:hypothetical protein
MMSALSVIALALFLLVPSAGIIEKYLGQGGVWLYWLIGGLLLWLIMRPGSWLIRWALRLKPRVALVLLALTFGVLVAAFIVIYPIANTGLVGGGSDGDEAVNLGVKALWQRQYPYYATTYLDNPVVTLGGGLVLSTPAVFLGNSAYQSLFWLLVFVLALHLRLRDLRLTLLLVWVTLLFAPLVCYEILTGGDRTSNTLAVLVSLQWLMSAIRFGQRRALIAAILVGLSLAWRLNFLLLLPLIVLAVWRTTTPRQALLINSVILIVIAAAIVPFYLYDPAGFAPLRTGLKLLLPSAAVVITALTGGLAMLLAFTQPRLCSLWRLFRSSAVVLAVPIWLVMILVALLYGRGWSYFAGYGIFALYFAVASLGVELLRRASSQSVPAARAPTSPALETPV